MKQFLSNTVTHAVVRLRDGPPCKATGLRKHSRALIVAMIGCVSCWIGAGYLPQDNHTIAVLTSLLSGFEPLIYLFVLLIIVALAISFLICSVERTLAEEDDGIVPESHLKSKWRGVAHFLFDQLSDRLSLKEHSPPAFLFS